MEKHEVWGAVVVKVCGMIFDIVVLGARHI